MRLSAVEVEKLKVHVQPVRLQFGDGITVVYGPNEAGKSTILEAIRCAVALPFSSKATIVEQLAPWGTEGMSPTVALEVVHEGKRYRFRKRWLDDRLATLERIEGGHAKALAEGEKAEERFRAFLGAKGRPDGRAGSEALDKYGGLAQVLFAPQRHIVLDGSLNPDATASLHAVVGETVESAESLRLRRALEVKQDEYWAPKGGERKNSPAKTSETEVERAQTEHDTARVAHESYKTLERELVAAQAQEAKTEQDGRERAERVRQLKERVEPFRAAKQSLTDAMRIAEERSVAAESLQERLGAAERAALDERQLAEQKREIEGGREAAERALARVREDRNTLRLRTTERDEQRRALDESVTRLDATRGFSDLGERLESRRRLAQKVSASQSIVSNWSRDLERLARATRDDVRALSGMVNRVADYERRIAATQIKVHIAAEAAISVRGLPNEGPRQLGPGEQLEARGDGSLRLEIEGVAALEVSGPPADIEQLRSELTKLEVAIEKLRTRTGTADPGELLTLVMNREGLENRIAEAKRSLERELDGRTLEELQEEIAGIEGERDRLMALHAGLEQMNAEALAGDVQSRREDLEKLDSTLGAERERIDAADTAANEDMAQVNQRAEAWTQRDTQVKIAKAGALQGLDLETLRRMRTESGVTQLDAERDVERKREALANLGEDPEGELERVTNEERALGESLRRESELRAALQERMSGLAAQRPLERLAEIEPALQEARWRLVFERRTAEALRLLRDLVSESDAELQARLAGPITARVQRWYGAITGRPPEAVRFDDSFRTTGLTLQRGLEVDPEQLSVGTVDQLGLSVRLALATALAEQHPDGVLPCILDDPLVQADPNRQRRALRVLEEASERLQLIVFTCDRARYLECANASFQPMLSVG